MLEVLYQPCCRRPRGMMGSLIRLFQSNRRTFY